MMELTKTETIKIPSKAKVRVIWEGDPNEYTQEKQKDIQHYFVQKYGNPNVQVIFKPKKIITEHGEVEMTVADNVMDSEYQRKLFKQWLTDSKIEVDWERIIKLDDKVNEKLSQQRDIDYRYRNWYIKEIEWSNFLSYGDGNYLSYKELDGITVVTSDPANAGGKTILSYDLLLFLFFNTTTKGDTAIKMFNKFRDCNEVKVKGRVMIDGVDYIIERVVTRKLKRSGDEYTTRTDLSFCRILPDGSIENLEGEQRRETEEFIKKSIGSVDDFLLTIMANADSLEDIINTKPTEKGRILSRFIGLEVIEDKETIVKEMRSGWSKGLKSDAYSTVELEQKNVELNNDIKLKHEQVKDNSNKLEDTIKDIEVATVKKESFLSKKIEIDTEILNIRIDDIERDINTITSNGAKRRDEYDELKREFDLLTEPIYDEDLHNDLLIVENDLKINKSHTELTINGTEKLIKSLEDGEICPTCKQDLKDIDHTEEIELNKNKLELLHNSLIEIIKQLDVASTKVKEINEVKKSVTEYDRTSLKLDKLDLDLQRFRMDLKEKKELKKSYESNIENIETNKKLDTEILGYQSKLVNLDREKNELIRTIERLESEIRSNEDRISKNQEYIKIIKAEEDIKIIFDIYLRMVGKNGIVKMIMKTVIPLINSELDRLLMDTVNFKLKVDLNDKKEVEFLICKETEDGTIVEYPITEGSGLEKTVSSLALRFVMTKISCLPKPNIIVLDEVFGKVANVNLEYVGYLFDKVKSMFPNIFIISHNPLVQSWATNLITVNKIKNISSINRQ